MIGMKARDLREMSVDELAQHERETRSQLLDLRLRVSTGDESEKPVRMRLLRREIGRILTIRGEQGKSE